MNAHTAIHVVPRADGVWHVEREDRVTPSSVHSRREDAIDAALALATRERRPLAIHRRPRTYPRWLDLQACAFLRRVASVPARSAG